MKHTKGGYYNVLAEPELAGVRDEDWLHIAENLHRIEDQLAAILEHNRLGVWLDGKKDPKPKTDVERFALELASKFNLNEPDIRTLMFRIHRVGIWRAPAAYYCQHCTDKRTAAQKETDWTLANTVLLREAKFICEYVAAMPMPKRRAMPAGERLSLN
jgi:hypothetical protein